MHHRRDIYWLNMFIYYQSVSTLSVSNPMNVVAKCCKYSDKIFTLLIKNMFIPFFATIFAI